MAVTRFEVIMRRPLSAGAALVIVNAQPTPFDNSARVVLRGDIGTVLPAIITELVPLLR